MDKLAQILEELAQKFGTTVEHLWGVLIAQSKIAAISYIIEYVICLTLLFVIITSLLKSMKPVSVKVKDGWDDKEIVRKFNSKWEMWANRDDDIAALAGVLYGVAIAVSTIWTATCINRLPLVFASIFNQEFWALQQVLTLLK